MDRAWGPSPPPTDALVRWLQLALLGLPVGTDAVDLDGSEHARLLVLDRDDLGLPVWIDLVRGSRRWAEDDV